MFQERLGDGRSVVNFPAFRMQALRSRGTCGSMATCRSVGYRAFCLQKHINTKCFERLHILDRNYAQYSGIEVLDLATGIRTAATVRGCRDGRPYAKEHAEQRCRSMGREDFFGRDGDGSKIFLYMAFAIRTPEKSRLPRW